MKVIANSSVQHDGELYVADEVLDIPEDAAKQLVSDGVVRAAPERSAEPDVAAAKARAAKKVAAGNKAKVDQAKVAEAAKDAPKVDE